MNLENSPLSPVKSPFSGRRDSNPLIFDTPTPYSRKSTETYKHNLPSDKERIQELKKSNDRLEEENSNLVEENSELKIRLEQQRTRHQVKSLNNDWKFLTTHKSYYVVELFKCLCRLIRKINLSYGQIYKKVWKLTYLLFVLSRTFYFLPYQK